MKVLLHIAHMVLPRESNNQKAKLLHSSSLALILFGLIFYQIALDFLPTWGVRVLGYAANIPPSEVIRLTNQKRAEADLPSLEENPILSKAAQAKGADMLTKGYWAHVSPDGTQPWNFFTDFGYSYRYAGENLARDFADPGSAVDAWMASPSHRENLLSPRYKDIGVAVVEGNLGGVDTTIIVQFFGTKYGGVVPTVPVAKTQPATSATQIPITQTTPAPQHALQPSPQVLFSPFTATKNASLIIVGVLLAVLIIDAFVVARRRIERIGGRTFAHLSFFGMILVILLIAKAGAVL